MRRRLAGIAGLAACALLAGCTGSSSAPPSSGASGASGSTGVTTAPTVTDPSTSSGPVATGSAVPTISVRTVKLSDLDGATVPTTFVLDDDTAGVTESKFYLVTGGDMSFLARAKQAPFEASVRVPPGPTSILVRHDIGGDRQEVTASFTAKSGLLGNATAVPGPPGIPATITPPAPTVNVSTAAQLASAVQAARPGTVIHLEDGTYVNDGGDRWHLAASGTATSPITLEGGRGAVLESDSTSGDYGLWITGSHWQILGISVKNASKGIVLDRSVGTIIDGVEVSDIGDEGVHFRTCSSDGVLQNSSVHDTGSVQPSYGEGVYVGSANSNWSKYGCSGGQDKSENVLIRNNRFTHIAAEGADLKEGTDSGTLVGNVFSDAGYGGQNSADSAVDVKGNHWTIAGNTVQDPGGADLDAFQTHQVTSGYGTANVFIGNHVLGDWPGFGFGLYPAGANIVTCDNMAAGAAQGLVGDDGDKTSCAS